MIIYSIDQVNVLFCVFFLLVVKFGIFHCNWSIRSGMTESIENSELIIIFCYWWTYCGLLIEIVTSVWMIAWNWYVQLWISSVSKLSNVKSLVTFDVFKLDRPALHHSTKSHWFRKVGQLELSNKRNIYCYDTECRRRRDIVIIVQWHNHNTVITIAGRFQPADLLDRASQSSRFTSFTLK